LGDGLGDATGDALRNHSRYRRPKPIPTDLVGPIGIGLETAAQQHGCRPR
jgi:hypothetical protein